MNRNLWLCAGLMLTSSVAASGTIAPLSSAFAGVRQRGDMWLTGRAPGIAPPRAQENASRAPAPWTAEPQEKHAWMMATGTRSWIHGVGLNPGMNGPTPTNDAASAYPLLPRGIAGSSAGTRRNDEIPPKTRALRMARGI